MAETQPVEAPKKAMKRQLSNDSCISYCSSNASKDIGDVEKINLELEDRI